MRKSHLLLVCIWLPLLLGAAAPRPAPPPAPAIPVPVLFSGESLTYDISYLWFNRLAEGRLSFTPGEHPGTFQAELTAKTLGVASWLTGDRVHRYVSLMAWGDDNQLHTLRHESLIIKGKGANRVERSKLYRFDYDQGEIRYQRFRSGKSSRPEVLPLDLALGPNDILTAFFNFRLGVFGPLRSGKRYRIPTFSHEGVSEIVIETVADSERHQFPFFPREGLLARVTVDPEVFDTGGGHVYVWFDPSGRPARGIVENIVALGSVRGELQAAP
ncbi:MAG: DUF3108 domain-containing protein [Desulfuromonadales bacterium]|nr:DUF3108 domain-containing protein [Desulfuromonadales bacterium]